MKNPFKKSARSIFEEALRRHEELNLALGAAEEAMVAAVEARVAASGQDDATLDRLDAAVESAKVAHQRALERFTKACDALDEAEKALSAEGAAERAKKAASLRANFTPKVLEFYAESARATLTALKAIAVADADLARLETLPEGRRPESIERDARFQEWLQETEISRKRMALWANVFGQPLPEQPKPADIREDREGHFLTLITTGTMSTRNGRLAIQRREFECVEFKSDRLNRRWHEPLFKGIVLPAVSDPGARLWPPRAPLSDQPEAIIAAVDAALARLDDQLEALRLRRDERPIEVRFEPVQAAPMDEGEDALDADESAPGDDGEGEFNEGSEPEESTAASGKIQHAARRLAASSSDAIKPALRGESGAIESDKK